MIRLMIADDETSARDDMIQYIDWIKSGITVIGTADDGNSAYNMILEQKPDIVLIDIEMPGMSGLDVIQKVRTETDLRPAFIIVSGYDDFSYAQKAIELSVDQYLLKPFLPMHVLHAVHRSIEKLEMVGRQSSPSFFNFYDSLIGEQGVPSLNYPSEAEQRLIRTLHLGSQSEALEAFEFFWKQASELNPQSAALLSCGLLLYMEMLRQSIERGYKLFSNPFASPNWSLETASDTLYHLLRDLVYNLNEHFARGQKYSKSPVSRAAAYIEAHYCEDLSLDTVAKAVYVTPSYLSSLFTQMLGVGFVDYVHRLRIERAKELLSQTNLRNYEIAEQIGYTDHKYFAQVFKKFTGITPSEYRNQHHT